MLTFISLETEQYYCIDPCVLTVDDKGERLENSAAHVNRDKYTGRVVHPTVDPKTPSSKRGLGELGMAGTVMTRPICTTD